MSKVSWVDSGHGCVYMYVHGFRLIYSMNCMYACVFIGVCECACVSVEILEETPQGRVTRLEFVSGGAESIIKRP